MRMLSPPPAGVGRRVWRSAGAAAGPAWQHSGGADLSDHVGRGGAAAAAKGGCGRVGGNAVRGGRKARQRRGGTASAPTTHTRSLPPLQVFVLLIGINNQDPKEAAEHLSFLLAYLAAAAPSSRVVVLAPLPTKLGRGAGLGDAYREMLPAQHPEVSRGGGGGMGGRVDGNEPARLQPTPLDRPLTPPTYPRPHTHTRLRCCCLSAVRGWTRQTGGCSRTGCTQWRQGGTTSWPACAPRWTTRSPQRSTA